MQKNNFISEEQIWRYSDDFDKLHKEIISYLNSGYFIRELSFDYVEEEFYLIVEKPLNRPCPKQYISVHSFFAELEECVDYENEEILKIIYSDFQYIVLLQEVQKPDYQKVEGYQNSDSYDEEELDLEDIPELEDEIREEFNTNRLLVEDIATQWGMDAVLFRKNSNPDCRLEIQELPDMDMIRHSMQQHNLWLKHVAYMDPFWYFSLCPREDVLEQEFFLVEKSVSTIITEMRRKGFEIEILRPGDEGDFAVFTRYKSKGIDGMVDTAKNMFHNFFQKKEEPRQKKTETPLSHPKPAEKQKTVKMNIQDRYISRYLKTYVDDEKLANNHRKYRSVFNAAEISELFVEFGIINKMHRTENWTMDLIFKLFDISTDNKDLISSINHKQEVMSGDVYVHFRNHVGRARQGTFLRAGKYLWEAWLDGESVEECEFHVIESLNEKEKWFTFDSIRLFEDASDMGNGTNRIYYRKFDAARTRSIGIEILGYSKYLSKWQMELFAIYRDAAGNLKNVSHINTEIDPDLYDDHMMGVQTCAGKDTPGFWEKGFYSIDLIFMGKKLAHLVFEVADDFEEGGFDLSKVILSDKEKTDIAEQIKAAQGKDNMLSESIAQLDNLVGLQNLKKEMHAHIDYVNFISKRGEKGLSSSSFPLHMIFTGSPGTGKTTVAMMLGKIYKAMGILSKGHMVVEERSTLIGKYYGSCEINTKQAIEKAEGGILFIDEAYNLFRKDDPKDPGKDILDTLLTRLSSDDQDIIVVLAGYTDEMLELLDYNPGIRSRFPNHFHFNDFSGKELLEIAHMQAKEKSLILGPEVDKALQLLFEESVRNADKSFGNGRFVHNIISKMMIHMGSRLAKHENYDALSEQALSEVMPEDIPFFDDIKKLATAHLIDEDMYSHQIDKINKMIGLQEIKKEIRDFARLIRYYSESGRNVRAQVKWVSLFLGRSGQGITTVANYFAGLLQSLRIIKRKHVTELHHDIIDFNLFLSNIHDIRPKIEEASGGVLLVDFGKQIHDHELISKMLTGIFDLTKYGGNRVYVIICGDAGQEENEEMEYLTDPGMEVDLRLHFGEYSLEEIWEIFSLKLGSHNLSLDENAREIVWDYINRMIRENYLLSPQIMKKLADKIARTQHLRMAHLRSEQRKADVLKNVTADDVADLIGLQNIIPDRRNFR